MPATRIKEGRRRVVVEGVTPEIDAGRYPIKRVVGDRVVVEADAFTDGHDMLTCLVLYRREGAEGWSEAPMQPLVNDRWRGEFAVAEQGRYVYTVQGWVDYFKTWARDLSKRVGAGQDVTVEMQIGAALVQDAARRAGEAGAELKAYAKALKKGDAEGIHKALSPDLLALMERYPDRSLATTYERELGVVVDRQRAQFSAWYEFFPRSTSPKKGQHGTFQDALKRLDYVAAMGFDVVYFPPIHPIGATKRKGKNNAVVAEGDDPGSPWAIGGEAGGHKSIHPELGTLEDFQAVVARAKELGMEIALDIAFQVAPDHPYVKEHPSWFKWRPDNTVQYAENPPKKYEDIYPFNFESKEWRELWEELKSVFVYWIEQDVRIFRVDNPHTKPFPFWEWCIDELKREYPDVLFLAEAFTRPKLMYRLAKLGYSQSYTYFAWRNNKWELMEYLTELTHPPVHDFFRPNFWPNTPDILTEPFWTGKRPVFATRFILAATLTASYGIYGPAYELYDHRPHPGKEEYTNNEKYELKHWNIGRADSLRPLITRINAIRRQNPALHSNASLRFHQAENDQLICYSKSTEDRSNIILVVVNLDPDYTQAGMVELNLAELGLEAHERFRVHDLLNDKSYEWHGARNYVELDPFTRPAHIFRVEKI